MRVGVDSYSYHRLLGDVRTGERAPPTRFRDGSLDVLAEARRLGVEVASLQTCFLPPLRDLDARELRAAAGPVEIVLAWGHPDGLAFGGSPDAPAALLGWIAAAPSVGSKLVRLVVGSPAVRRAREIDAQIRATVPLLEAACASAGARGIELAVENHADLTVAELIRLVDAVGDQRLRVCLDTANALRVGDDPVDAVRVLGGRIGMVHLKDCEDPSNADPRVGPRSRRYGDGAARVADVVAALASEGFAGPVCVELGQLGADVEDERELVASCVGWLRAELDALARRPA